MNRFQTELRLNEVEEQKLIEIFEKYKTIRNFRADSFKMDLKLALRNKLVDDNFIKRITTIFLQMNKFVDLCRFIRNHEEKKPNRYWDASNINNLWKKF